MKTIFAPTLLLLSLIACGGSDSNKNTTDQDIDPTVSAEQLKTNRMAFIELATMIEFFHPDGAAVYTDWEAFAINQLPVVEKAHDRPSLVKALQLAFHSVAPTVSIDGVAGESVPYMADSTHRAFWMHENFSQSYRDDLGYISELKIIPRVGDSAQLLPSNNVYSGAISGEIEVSIPLVFPADEERPVGTSGRVPADNATTIISAGNPSARIMAFGRAWGALHHFYPYFEEIDYDSKAILSRGIDLAETASDAIELKFAIRRGLADFQDGHIFVFEWQESNGKAWPVFFDLIEDNVVVVASIDEEIERGDIVTSVNGEAAHDIVARQKDIYPLAPEKRAREAAVWLIDEYHTQPVTIIFQKQNGEEYAKVIERNFDWDAIISALKSRYPEAGLVELEPGYYYLNGYYFTNGNTLTDLAEAINNASGLIVDPRPQWAYEFYELAAALSNDGFLAGQMKLPHVKQPNLSEINWTDITWSAPAHDIQIRVPTAIIVNPHTQSAGETMLGAYMYNNTAIGVGEATHGANGVITGISILDGQIDVMFTGFHVANYDGTQLQAIGILPDVIAKRTVEGVRLDKLEIVEAALAALKDQRK